MFKVKNKKTGDVYMVYGVKSRNEKTMFLVWELNFHKTDGYWTWHFADGYEPIMEDK